MKRLLLKIEHIAWADELSVKIKYIDEQHKILVRVLNELADAIENKNGAQKIRKVLHDLSNFAMIHFYSEEAIMEEFNFPDLQEHHDIHQQFFVELKIFKLKMRALIKIKADEKLLANLALEILQFLKEWVKNHLIEDDSKYREYFTKENLFKEINENYPLDF